MTIVLTWLVQSLLIAAILAGAAASWEVASRWSGRPARWAWLGALAGSVTLPWLVRLLPEPAALPAIAMTLPVLSLEPIVAGATTSGGGWSVLELSIAAWVALSVVALAYVVYLMVQLGRARRGWQAREVDGERVFVTRSTGPAALGVREAMVVIPAWVLELDAELRGLLLRHEREHVNAGDPKLLLAGLVLVATMPWNPVLWLQLLRLRNAIELDCDSRVLAGGADPERYGSLLLEVGRRRSNGALVMATFAEPRVFLRERIRRIAKWPLERRRGRAWLFSAIALVLCATALSARDPLRARVGADAGGSVGGGAGGSVGSAASVGASVEASVGASVEASVGASGNTAAGESTPAFGAEHGVLPSDTPPTRPFFTPMTVAPELQNSAEVRRALEEHYPPMLRDAGIGGRPTVWFYIDADGVVQASRLEVSSGHPQLDEAALAVARMMRFSPALNLGERVAVWVQLPIIFGPPSAAPAQSSARRPQPGARPRPADPAPADPAPRSGRPGQAQASPQPETSSRRQASPQPETLSRPQASLPRVSPPRPAAAQQGASAGPFFTPMTDAPELANREAVLEALQRHYPPMLRDAGIGGRPTVWFYINADGIVESTRLSQSSGHEALDGAALRVASSMVFSPALNRGQPVAVWVELPIIFTAR